MKTVEELKVGDICYWFTMHGEYKGEVKVESIEIDDDSYLGKRYYIKIQHQILVRVRHNEDKTYGDSVDFPDMMVFFSKEAAIIYFLNKIEKEISILKSSINETMSNTNR